MDLVVVVVAAASSSPADLLLPITVAAVVLILVVVVGGGAIDGRAAFSDPRPPAVSCSFSLRFSLRACDFEYGAREASNPVVIINDRTTQAHQQTEQIHFVSVPPSRSDG